MRTTSRLPIPSTVITHTLIGALGFGAVSAVAGGMFALSGTAPSNILVGTPFTSFVVPGLILGLVVGGTQFAAAVAVIRAHPARLLLAAVAGFGMLIWIFTELAMIGYYFLQTVYFTLGGVELILVLALLGVAPSLLQPAPHLGTRHQASSGPPERTPAL